MLPLNTSSTNSKEKIKSKTPQTEWRLSDLLEKIRSKSYIRGSENPLLKDEEIARKMLTLKPYTQD